MGCNSDYRLRFCNVDKAVFDCDMPDEVATAITACGIKKRHNDFYGRYVSFFVRRSFEKLLALYCAILCIYKAYKNIKSGKKISIIVDI